MRVQTLCLLSILMLASNSYGQALAPEFSSDKRYMTQIRLHTPMELEALLERASGLVGQAQQYKSFEPIAVVLHGNEANAFRFDNYQRYRKLIDLAARLDAYKVIDVKICETWMRVNNVQRSELPAFVDTVPFGPAEQRQLYREGYQSF